MRYLKIIIIIFFIGISILAFFYYQNQKQYPVKAYEMDAKNYNNFADTLNGCSNLTSKELFIQLLDGYAKMNLVRFLVIRDENWDPPLYTSSPDDVVQEKKYITDTDFMKRVNVTIDNKKYTVTFGTKVIAVDNIIFSMSLDEVPFLIKTILVIFIIIVIGGFVFLKFGAKNLLANVLNIGKVANSKIDKLFKSSDEKKLVEFVKTTKSARDLAEEEKIKIRQNTLTGSIWAEEQIRNNNLKTEIVVGDTDVNSFSTLQQMFSEAQLKFHLGAFFDPGCEFINRYGGKVEGLAGDRITFFIPKNEVKNAEICAVHAMRGIIESMKYLNESFTFKPFEITTKCSIASGNAEFEKQGGTAKTNSSAFTYAARILSTVSHKDVSTISFLSTENELLKSHLDIYMEDVETFDKMKGEHKVSRSKRVFGYNKNKKSCLEFLEFYRTDDDIINIIDHMIDELRDNNFSYWDRLYKHLMSINISLVHQSVADAYLKLLMEATLAKNNKLIASVAAFGKVILIGELNKKEIMELLNKISSGNDQRAACNSLETIFKHKKDTLDLYRLSNDQNNRVAATFLVALIQKEGLTDMLLERLTSWIETHNKAFQLSSAWVIYTIYEYWINYKPEYVEANENFERLDKLVDKLNHKDPSFSKWINQYKDLKTNKLANNFR